MDAKIINIIKSKVEEAKTNAVFIKGSADIVNKLKTSINTYILEVERLSSLKGSELTSYKRAKRPDFDTYAQQIQDWGEKFADDLKNPIIKAHAAELRKLQDKMYELISDLAEKKDFLAIDRHSARAAKKLIDEFKEIKADREERDNKKEAMGLTAENITLLFRPKFQRLIIQINAWFQRYPEESRNHNQIKQATALNKLKSAVKELDSKVEDGITDFWEPKERQSQELVNQLKNDFEKFEIASIGFGDMTPEKVKETTELALNGFEKIIFEWDAHFNDIYRNEILEKHWTIIQGYKYKIEAEREEVFDTLDVNIVNKLVPEYADILEAIIRSRKAYQKHKSSSTPSYTLLGEIQEIKTSILDLNEKIGALQKDYLAPSKDKFETAISNISKTETGLFAETKVVNRLFDELKGPLVSSLGSTASTPHQIHMSTANLDLDNSGVSLFRFGLTPSFLRDAYGAIYMMNNKYMLMPEEDLEERRKQLFKMRGASYDWLDAYSKKDSPTSKDNERKEKLETLLVTIKGALTEIGKYVQSKDNFLDIKDAYQDFLSVKIPVDEAVSAKKKIRTDQKAKKTMESISEAIDLVNMRSKTWQSRHPKIQGFENYKHKREIVFMLKDVNKYASEIGVRPIIGEVFIKKEYNAKKDKLYDSIVEGINGISGNLTKDSAKRLRLLGNIEEKITEWKIWIEDYKDSGDNKLNERKAYLIGKEVGQTGTITPGVGRTKIEEEFKEASSRFKLDEDHKTIKTQFDELLRLSDKYDEAVGKTSRRKRLRTEFLGKARTEFDLITTWLAGYKLVQDKINSRATTKTAETKRFEKAHKKQKKDILGKEATLKDSLSRLTGFTAEKQSGFLIYNTIIKMKDSLDYNYNALDDAGVKLRKLKIIADIDAEIQKWNNQVSELKIEPFNTTISDYRNELNTERLKYSNNAEPEDKVYKKIEELELELKALTTVTKENAKLKSSIEKLIVLWRKQNKYKTTANGTNWEKIKVLEVYLKKLGESTDIKNLELFDEVKETYEKVSNIIEKGLSKMDSRQKLVQRQKLKNVKVLNVEGQDEIDEIFTEFTKDLKRSLKTQEIPIGDHEEELARVSTISDTEERETDGIRLRLDMLGTLNDIKDLETSYSRKQIELQDKLYKANRAKEQKIFASLGPYDYDFLTSGAFTSREIELMNKAFQNALDRFYAVRDSGGSVDDAMRMIEHIPVSMLPDKLVKELHRWRVTQEAFEKEEKEKAEEEFKKSDFNEFLESIGEVYGTTKMYDSLFYKEKGEKEKRFLFTREKMSKAQKKIEEVLGDVEIGLTAIEDVSGIIDAVSVTERKARRKKLIMSSMKLVLDTLSTVAEKIEDKKFEMIVKDVATGMKLISLIPVLKDKSQSAKTTKAYIDANVDKFEKIASGLLGAGVTAAKTVNTFHKMAFISDQIVPGLGVATGSVSLGVNVYKIANEYLLKKKTSALYQKAVRENPDYVEPLEQEISSLNKRMAKKAVDSVSDGVSIAGGVATLTGVGAIVGASLAFTAGAIKLGNKVVFTSINEAQMKKAEALRIRATKFNDREAQMEIFSKSPKYAKMFLAIGATKTPPDPIALEFILHRGITEKDIQRQEMSAMVVRKYLLKISDEQDNHDGVSGMVKEWYTKLKRTWQNYKQRKNFWDGTPNTRAYSSLMDVYPPSDLQELIENARTIFDGEQFLAALRNTESNRNSAKDKLLEIKTVLEGHLNALDKAYETGAEKLESARKALITNPLDEDASNKFELLELTLEQITTERNEVETRFLKYYEDLVLV
ncbi:MAG: hypothetical protein AAF502_12810 [Bacteroidota bacterium]